MSRRLSEIERYEELAEYLQSWYQHDLQVPEGQYDFVGMIRLLAACLTSLRTYASESEIEDLRDHLDEQEQTFLRYLSSQLPKTVNPDD